MPPGTKQGTAHDRNAWLRFGDAPVGPESR